MAKKNKKAKVVNVCHMCGARGDQVSLIADLVYLNNEDVIPKLRNWWKCIPCDTKKPIKLPTPPPADNGPGTPKPDTPEKLFSDLDKLFSDIADTLSPEEIKEALGEDKENMTCVDCQDTPKQPSQPWSCKECGYVWDGA